MKKRLLTITVVTSLLWNCTSTKPLIEEKPIETPEIVEIKEEVKPLYYQDVLFENITLKVESQYVPLTLVTYTHTESDLVGKKRLFELYGNWQKALNLSTSEHPLLVWKAIPFLDGTSKKMTFIVDGKLTNEVNEISFFVYDSLTKENLLATNSPYKELILKKIDQLLATNDPANKAFEKKFWKDFYFVDIYEGEDS